MQTLVAMYWWHNNQKTQPLRPKKTGTEPPSPPTTLAARGVCIFLYLVHKMITKISEPSNFQASFPSTGGGTPIRNVHTPVAV